MINYINGTTDNNSLVKKIDNTIKEIKKQEEGRIDYMLTTLRDMDSRIEGEYIGERRGKRIGETQKAVNDIRSLIEVFNFSTEQAMKGLKIPVEEQGLYFRLVNDPDFCEKYFADKSNFIDPSDYEDEDFEENEEDYYEKDEE